MPTVSPPASIGDEKGERYRIVADERPLPNNRKEVISAVESILSLGHVQKLIVEVHKPIKFFRAVVGEDIDGVPKEILDDEEFANVRNAEIQEFLNITTASFHEHIFKGFQYLTQKRLKARSFLYNNPLILRSAMGLDSHTAITELFGVGAIQSDEVPADVLLLSATRYGEEEIVFTLRMLIPTKRTK
jgi:hypothetical protein